MPGRKIVRISSQFLLELFKTRREPWRFPTVKVQGLPSDVRFVSLWTDVTLSPRPSPQLLMLVESPEFPEVPPGKTPPELTIEFEDVPD